MERPGPCEDCLARAVRREISACWMISVSGGWWVAGLGRGWKFHHWSSSSESVLEAWSGSAPVRNELESGAYITTSLCSTYMVGNIIFRK